MGNHMIGLCDGDAETLTCFEQVSEWDRKKLYSIGIRNQFPLLRVIVILWVVVIAKNMNVLAEANVNVVAHVVRYHNHWAITTIGKCLAFNVARKRVSSADKATRPASSIRTPRRVLYPKPKALLWTVVQAAIGTILFPIFMFSGR